MVLIRFFFKYSRSAFEMPRKDCLFLNGSLGKHELCHPRIADLENRSKERQKFNDSQQCPVRFLYKLKSNH